MFACDNTACICQSRKHRSKGPSICRNDGRCDSKREVPPGKFPRKANAKTAQEQE